VSFVAEPYVKTLSHKTTSCEGLVSQKLYLTKRSQNLFNPNANRVRMTNAYSRWSAKNHYHFTKS